MRSVASLSKEFSLGGCTGLLYQLFLVGSFWELYIGVDYHNFCCVPLQCCGKLLTLASWKMVPVSGLNTINWVLSVIFILLLFWLLPSVQYNGWILQLWLAVVWIVQTSSFAQYLVSSWIYLEKHICIVCWYYCYVVTFDRTVNRGGSSSLDAEARGGPTCRNEGGIHYSLRS